MTADEYRRYQEGKTGFAPESWNDPYWAMGKREANESFLVPPSTPRPTSTTSWPPSPRRPTSWSWESRTKTDFPSAQEFDQFVQGLGVLFAGLVVLGILAGIYICRLEIIAIMGGIALTIGVGFIANRQLVDRCLPNKKAALVLSIAAVVILVVLTVYEVRSLAIIHMNWNGDEFDLPPGMFRKWVFGLLSMMLVAGIEIGSIFGIKRACQRDE